MYSLNDIQEVRGSIPLGSTMISNAYEITETCVSALASNWGFSDAGTPGTEIKNDRDANDAGGRMPSYGSLWRNVANAANALARPSANPTIGSG